jgi:hypothetical protein
MRVRGMEFDSISTMLQMDFGKLSDSMVFFPFYYKNPNLYLKHTLKPIN